MADKRERPSLGFYKFANFCPAVKGERLPTKKPCLQGDFFIERIISRRGQGAGKEYLIKWKGYSRAECTWEPQRYIPEHLIRTLYDNPEPSSERVEEAVVKFNSALKAKLKSKSLDPMFVVDMDHDVFRFLFRGKGHPSPMAGAILLEKEDFDRMPLLNAAWWYCLSRIGEGSAVGLQAPSFVQEIVSFYMTTNPCSVDNLRVH